MTRRRNWFALRRICHGNLKFQGLIANSKKAAQSEISFVTISQQPNRKENLTISQKPSTEREKREEGEALDAEVYRSIHAFLC
uniref:Uncharacterized protein n=1 Tax=Rhizophora mucronata TaxID=61149 RepID=A0A2P2PJF7_RHIMU